VAMIWITYTHVTVLLTDMKLDCIFAEFIVWDGLKIGKLDNAWCEVEWYQVLLVDCMDGFMINKLGLN